MIIQGRTSLPDAVQDCQVVISGDRIAEVRTEAETFEKADIEIGGEYLICPGFIDPQINGGFGKEFKSNDDAVEHVTREIVRYGVTSIVPTITTLPLEKYRDHLKALMNTYTGPVPNARVLGLHLEGPALSAAKRGAHPEDLLLNPRDLELESYLNSDVRIVTIAPELPGGWTLAEELIKRGLRVGLGHSTAKYEDVLKHFDFDAMHVVHVFNAMSEFAGRSPGLIGLTLDQPSLYASLIADLVHVHPAGIRAVWNAHDAGAHIFAVSDGSAVLGLPAGEHQVGARQIERRADRAVLSGTETLVGSVLTMNVAARNIRQVTGCELWHAVNFVTKNTAEYLGMNDEIGSIRAGALADLAIVNDDFDVLITIVGGSIVYDQRPQD